MGQKLNRWLKANKEILEFIGKVCTVAVFFWGLWQFFDACEAAQEAMVEQQNKYLKEKRDKDREYNLKLQQGYSSDSIERKKISIQQLQIEAML